MSKNDLTEPFVGIEVGCSRHASRKEKHIGIAVVVVGKHGVCHNAHTMCTHHSKLIRDGDSYHFKTCTTAHVDGTKGFHFFEACSKKSIYLHNGLRFIGLLEFEPVGDGAILRMVTL